MATHDATERPVGERMELAGAAALWRLPRGGSRAGEPRVLLDRMESRRLFAERGGTPGQGRDAD
jgi:hypothetical protein